jgi:hypothetical protein
MKSRKAPDLVAAYNELHQQLLDGGVKPVLQRLDNEISRVLIKAINDKGIDYQLASPHDHRLNRIPVIRYLPLRVTPIFANKNHALNTLKWLPL